MTFLKDALFSFVGLFTVIEVLPYVLSKSEHIEIGIQTLVISVFAIGIAARNQWARKGGKQRNDKS